jgi:hypothetical protein
LSEVKIGKEENQQEGEKIGDGANEDALFPVLLQELVVGFKAGKKHDAYQAKGGEKLHPADISNLQGIGGKHPNEDLQNGNRNPQFDGDGPCAQQEGGNQDETNDFHVTKIMVFGGREKKNGTSFTFPFAKTQIIKSIHSFHLKFYIT